MHFTRVLFLIFFLLPFSSVAKSRANVNKVWNQKFEPYKKRREEYKKKEYERSKKDRLKFKPSKSSYNKKMMELSNKEKAEIKKVKEETQKKMMIPVFTGKTKQNDNTQKTMSDMTALKIEEGQKIQEIRNKYARLKIDEEKKHKEETYKIMLDVYEDWKSLYDTFKMSDFPMPNPEIEEVKKPERKSTKSFNKSKFRIYKRGIIGKRDAVYTPLAKKINIDKIKVKDKVRFKYKYKIQDAFERNQKSINKLTQDFIKQHNEALKKGNIKENQSYQNDKKNYILELQKLTIQKDKISKAIKKEMSKEMIIAEKPFRLEENKIRIDLERKYLEMTPEYIQNEFKKN